MTSTHFIRTAFSSSSSGPDTICHSVELIELGVKGGLRNRSPSPFLSVPGTSSLKPSTSDVTLVPPDLGIAAPTGVIATLEISTQTPPHRPCTPSPSVEHPGEHASRPSCEVASSTRECAIPVSQSRLKIVPTSSGKVMDARYSNRHHIKEDVDRVIYIIQPMEISYSRPTLPDHWVACEHPEGSVYFHDRGRNILTNAYLYDPVNLKVIENAVHDLLPKIPTQGLPSDTEIVLDIQDLGDPEGAQAVCGFYLSSWSQRVVFWHVEVGVELITKWERWSYDKAHLKCAAEAQFWTHIEIFPNHREMTGTMLDKLKDMVTHSYLDVMTSDTSTAPYDSMKLSQMLGVIYMIKQGPQDGSRIALIARTMSTFYRERYLNYHGQRGARLNRDESVLSESITRPRPLLFTLLSPLLFWNPDIYMIELERIWVDNAVNYVPWNAFISELKSDWQTSITPATVLLTANVGLLAIQSEDHPGFAQTASYVSTVFGLGNFLVCQILARQQRTRMAAGEDMQHAQAYLSRKEGSIFGLMTLAFVFSLPNAMFIWSMLTFLLAMSFIYFGKTSELSRILLALVLSLLAALILLILVMDWDNTQFNTQPSVRKKWLAPLKARLPLVFRCRKGTGESSNAQQDRHCLSWFGYHRKQQEASQV